jgi:hypothetical protein
VLPAAVTLPGGNVENDVLRSCRLVDQLDHAAELRSQSPW